MSHRITLKDVFGEVKAYLLIAVGLLIYSLAWVVFLIPNGLVGGGITGLSTIIQYCTGFDVAYSYIIINSILIVLAMKILGSEFGAKTIFAIVAVTVFLKLLPGIVPQSFITEFSAENGKMVCVIFAGALAGFGIGMAFMQGGSTGGTDIIALIISKYKRISPGAILLMLDIGIIALSLLIPNGENWSHRLTVLIYGYVLTGIMTFTIDFILTGKKQSVQLFIFTNKYEELADRICNDAHRGVTLLSSQGGYSKTDGKLVVVVVKRNETNKILKLINEVAPEAFVSIGSVMEVYGQGFEPMKKL